MSSAARNRSPAPVVPAAREHWKVDPYRVPAAFRSRIPRDAHVEVDAGEIAYFCIAGRRLLYEPNLDRLLRRLDVPRECLVLAAPPADELGEPTDDGVVVAPRSARFSW